MTTALNNSRDKKQSRVNSDFLKSYSSQIHNDSLENYLSVNNFFGNIFDTRQTNFRSKTAYDRMVREFAKFEFSDMVNPSNLRQNGIVGNLFQIIQDLTNYDSNQVKTLYGS